MPNSDCAVSTHITNIANRLAQRLDTQSECHQHAWWFLHAITGLSKAQLIARGSVRLSPSQKSHLNQWLEQFIDKHIPLQYLLGWVPFADLTITVRPPILIPRNDTEHWVTQLIKKLSKLPSKPITILDLCTGSGCIALALAKALPFCHVYGTDINSAAVELAKENAKKNNLTNATFMTSDLFDAFAKSRAFDVIVANPPYISEKEFLSLAQSVSKWEDATALIAPNKGTAILRGIIRQAPGYIKTNKELEKRGIAQLFLEIGRTQADTIKKLMKAAGYIEVAHEKDLAGNDRMVCGRIKNVAIQKKPADLSNIRLHPSANALHRDIQSQ